MGLGRTGWPIARLAVMAGLAFACLLSFVPEAASADPGDYVESFGPDGTPGTEFLLPNPIGVDQSTGVIYVGDTEAGILYKFDASGNPLDWGGAGITGHELTGVSFSAGIAQVAVDSETHVIYVTSANNTVKAFEANGEPHPFSAVEGEKSELPGAAELRGVAVDGSGNIYTSDLSAKKVRIYKPSGVLVTEFSPLGDQGSGLGPGNLAVAPDGTLYITDVTQTQLTYALEPSKFPVSSKTLYGNGQPLDHIVSSTVAVDPNTQYVYVGQLCPASCNYRIAAYTENGVFVSALGDEEPGELEGPPVGIALNGGSERLFAAVIGQSPSALSQVAVFEALRIPVGPPTILQATATEITSSSAVLRSRINPNAVNTTYWFEYGLEDCALISVTCAKLPSSGASIGSGHNAVPVSASLSGLSPGTKYFFRVIAENEKGAATGATATRTFITQAAKFGSSLGDQRVWEMVTPSNKYSGVVTNAGLLQATPDGSGIAFQSRGSLVEDPEGNRALELSATLARRGASGWNVEDLVPRHTEAGGLGFGPEFKLFSQDLGQALLEPRDDTPLSPEASERAPYLRTNSRPSSYRPLVTSKGGFANVPSGTVFGGEVNGGRNPVSISGANGLLTHVVVSSQAPLETGAANRSIYLWNDGALKPVSELPEAGGVVTGELGSGTISVGNAISEDGSRVFWSPGNPLGANLAWPALYLRNTVDGKSVRLDEPEDGATEEGERHPVFMGASTDGSVVFFTDSQQLTEDASPGGRDLYRCETGDIGGGDLGCTDIEDLSAPLQGSGENGEAQELSLGMSEDGSSLYFIAGAVLDTKANGAGDVAAPGGPNLYLWKEGQGIRFIGLLSPEDRPDWGDLATDPIGHGARVAASSSPSGRYLVFMSEQNLTEADSNDPTTGQPVEQAFLYDAVEDTLLCISCNFNGATDPGHEIAKNISEGGVIFPDPQGLWAGRVVGATLPEPSEGEPTVGLTEYRPRAVLDNGRAFFNSVTALTAGDSNGTWDVYQYEPFGTGTCDQSAGNSMVAVGEGGCVSLLSSGTDEFPSVFMDASATGDDAFFATFAPLSALDTDKIVDVYDARVDGVAATAEPQPTECVGEACQPSGTPPNSPAPNSSTFNGAGNVKSKPRKHCKKNQRKVKRNGKTKCVKKKQHKKSAKTKGRS